MRGSIAVFVVLALLAFSGLGPTLAQEGQSGATDLVSLDMTWILNRQAPPDTAGCRKLLDSLASLPDLARLRLAYSAGSGQLQLELRFKFDSLEQVGSWYATDSLRAVWSLLGQLGFSLNVLNLDMVGGQAPGQGSREQGLPPSR
jgi:hypothetical protein